MPPSWHPARRFSGKTPARTIPPHFSSVSEATLEDFERVFGRDDGKNHFQIGQPIDMDVPVCLDLRRFVERSNGIFGKSGTGKSFLTRLLLCGVIKASAAVNLIFDMHEEYAFGKESEDGVFVKGLRDLFGAQIRVYSLDEASARRSGRSVDQVLKIVGLGEFERRRVDGDLPTGSVPDEV